MSKYKLDRTAFKAQIVEKPKLNADQIKAWHKQMSITYDYPENEPPKWIEHTFGTAQWKNKISHTVNNHA
jgi:hypothetical protein